MLKGTPLQLRRNAIAREMRDVRGPQERLVEGYKGQSVSVTFVPGEGSPPGGRVETLLLKAPGRRPVKQRAVRSWCEAFWGDKELGKHVRYSGSVARVTVAVLGAMGGKEQTADPPPGGEEEEGGAPPGGFSDKTEPGGDKC